MDTLRRRRKKISSELFLRISEDVQDMELTTLMHLFVELVSGIRLSKKTVKNNLSNEVGE